MDDIGKTIVLIQIFTIWHCLLCLIDIIGRTKTRTIERAKMKTYVKRIRDLREDNDKTQQEIADILGTSQTMYARYERGANEMPVHHLISLCKYYGVSSDYLLGIEQIKK